MGGGLDDGGTRRLVGPVRPRRRTARRGRLPRRPATAPRTYRDVLDRAERLAAGLARLGAGRGDRVAVVARNDPDTVHLLLACARLGAALVPVNARLSAPEIAGVLADAEPQLVFTDHGRRRAVLDAGIPEPFDLSGGVEELCRDREAITAPVPGAASVAVLAYTSGTTGEPKGAMLTAANLLAVCGEGMTLLGGFSRYDTVLVCLPLFHIAGLNILLFGLAAGARIVLLEDAAPQNIADAVERYRVTKMLLVPAIIRTLVAELEARQRPADWVNTLCFGASPMPEEVLSRARPSFPRQRSCTSTA